MSQAIQSIIEHIKRVAIYVRLSDEDKDKSYAKDLSESIKNQIAIGTAYCDERNWVVVGVYCDDDWSGLDRDRPDFNRLLQDCEIGKIDIVLCKDMSRFTRDKIVTEEFLETKFQEWGVRFIGLTDGTDTADKGNKKAREVNALVNQWYAEDISTKVKATFKNKQEEGLFIGSYATYGYVKSATVKGKLVVDPETAPIVRKIFILYLAGNGTYLIACILNAEGIPNPTAYKESKYPNYKNAFKKNDLGLWNKTTVKRILRNEVYLGSIVQHKNEKLHFKSKKRTVLPRKEWKVVEQTHEAIIDRDTFDKVQEIMDSNIRSTGEGVPHIFAGKVLCMDCGCNMVKSTRRQYSYLTCARYRTDSSHCSRHSIRLDHLIEIVTSKVRELLFAMREDREQFLNYLTANDDYAASLSSLKNSLNSTQIQIKNVTDALKKLYLDQTNRKMDTFIFNEIKEGLLQERNQLEKKLVNFQEELEKSKNVNNRLKYWAEVLDCYLDFSELTREMVVELVSSVQIGEKTDGAQEIVIHYSFNNLC